MTERKLCRTIISRDRLRELHARFDNDPEDDLSDVLLELDRPWRWERRTLMLEINKLLSDKTSLEAIYNELYEQHIALKGQVA